MKGLLNLRLKRRRTVKAVVQEVLFNNLNNNKYGDLYAIEFKVNCLNNILTISKAWLLINDKKVIKNLWIREKATNVSKLSNLGMLMEYYGVETIEDFIGKKVVLFPNYDGYLSIAGCPIDESVFKKTINKEDLYK